MNGTLPLKNALPKRPKMAGSSVNATSTAMATVAAAVSAIVVKTPM